MSQVLKHADITEKIIGCAFEVHKFLGNGFPEVIYQRALAIEFHLAGLKFEREVEQPIYYRNSAEKIGTRRADFIVEDKVLVELKATALLDDVHVAQLLNYLKVYRFEVGLVLNFGGRSMNFRRLAL